MGRRNDHSREEIRELALQAATQLIAEQGLSGLSARKIASAIGYTVGSLYLVFENLEELILHVNARTLDQLYEQLLQVVEQTESAEACLRSLGHGYLQFALDNTPSWRAVFDFHTENPLPDWYQDKINRLFALVETPISQQLSQLGQQDIEQVLRTSRTLWAGVHGICILAIGDKLEVLPSTSASSLLDCLMQNYLSGLSRPAAL